MDDRPSETSASKTGAVEPLSPVFTFASVPSPRSHLSPVKANNGLQGFHRRMSGSPRAKSAHSRRSGGFRPLQLPLSPPHFEEKLDVDQLVSFSPASLVAARSSPVPMSVPTAVAAAAIAEDMADLSLTYSPPPGKVRRRNALAGNDLFLQAREVQKLHDLSEATTKKMHEHVVPPFREFSEMSLRQRKKAVPRSLREKATASPPSPESSTKTSSSGDEEASSEVMQISLHADLRKYRPKGALQLPETILQKYSQTKAVVLYQPRVSIVDQILASKPKLEGADDVEEKCFKSATDAVATDIEML